eukprot:1160546-Pelagomonas_calceolata.AAC.6
MCHHSHNPLRALSVMHGMPGASCMDVPALVPPSASTKHHAWMCRHLHHPHRIPSLTGCLPFGQSGSLESWTLRIKG